MEISTAFWSNVRVHKDIDGSQPFEKLAKFALKILSLRFRIFLTCNVPVLP